MLMSLLFWFLLPGRLGTNNNNYNNNNRPTPVSSAWLSTLTSVSRSTPNVSSRCTLASVVTKSHPTFSASQTVPTWTCWPVGFISPSLANFFFILKKKFVGSIVLSLSLRKKSSGGKNATNRQPAFGRQTKLGPMVCPICWPVISGLVWAVVKNAGARARRSFLCFARNVIYLPLLATWNGVAAVYF